MSIFRKINEVEILATLPHLNKHKKKLFDMAKGTKSNPVFKQNGVKKILSLNINSLQILA